MSGWAFRGAGQGPSTAAVAAWAGGFFAVLAGWLLAGGAGERTNEIVTSVSSVVVTGAAAVFAALAARAQTGRAQSGWRAMAAGLSAATLAEVLWAGRNLLGWPLSFPSIADAAYLMFPVGVLVALLLFPVSRGRQSPGRLVLDGVIMGGSLLIVTWLTVMRQAYADGGDNWIRLVAALAYPVSNVVTLTVATVVLVRSGAGARSMLALLTLGLMCMTLAESVFAYFASGDGPFSGRHVIEIGCPAFVPLIEDGNFADPRLRAAAIAYLEPLLAEGVEAIVLGCTHYPLLEELLRELLPPEMVLVDPAQAAVAQLGRRLGCRPLQQIRSCGLHPREVSAERGRFCVTGDAEAFALAAAPWLGWQPQVEQVCLRSTVGAF